MLNDRSRSILRALMDAFVGDETSGAGVPTLDERSRDAAVRSLENALRGLPDSRQRTFERLLAVLDSPVASLLAAGRWVKLSEADPGVASRVLEKWSTSRLGTARRIFSPVKRAALFHAYGSERARRDYWTHAGLPAVGSHPKGAGRKADTVIPSRCETLVIGSGAGGAVAAAILAGRGHDVLVVEKGPNVPAEAMDGVETTAMEAMFEQAGLLTTSDGGINLLAGSCLGGGTTVNWSASFRLPDEIRSDWRRRHGIEWMTRPIMEAAYERIETRTGVGIWTAADNGPNAALRRGCRALGLEVREVPRNTPHCTGADAVQCGMCGLGCRMSRKQGTATTFLPDAVRGGASVVTGLEVDRILFEAGAARGVEGHLVGEGGREVVRIGADRVILAAGALHTPAILLRSGLTHPRIGRNLHIHPTVGVAGRYDATMRGWEGPIMSVYSEAFASMNGPWGVRIETPPIYPGLFASAIPWTNSKDHREDLNVIARTAAFIVLTRDRGEGRVVLDAEGSPSVQYRISDADLAAMLTGVIEATRIHLAAGAESVLFPHGERKVLEARGGEDRLADLAREIFGWGWRPGFATVFSAHQMGTCRMGRDPSQYPVDPEGHVRGVRGLYVCDGSIFPEASGVNPALTIQAMASCIAGQIG